MSIYHVVARAGKGGARTIFRSRRLPTGNRRGRVEQDITVGLDSDHGSMGINPMGASFAAHIRGHENTPGASFAATLTTHHDQSYFPSIPAFPSPIPPITVLPSHISHLTIGGEAMPFARSANHISAPMVTSSQPGRARKCSSRTADANAS